MAETGCDHSHLKLRIKFYSSSENPKEYVLYVPRSKKPQQSDPSGDDDVGCSNICKVVCSDTDHSSITKVDTTTVDEEGGKTRTTDKCGVAKTTIIGCEEKEEKKKESRVSNEGYCEKKDSVKIFDQYPKKDVSMVKIGATTHHSDIVKERERVGCKRSRIGKEEDCELKKNMKVQKNGKVVVLMDRSKKMECWVILKRLMTGKDSWVFKQPFMGLDILDNQDSSIHCSSTSKSSIKSEIVCNETQKKPTCMKDIESKLNNFLYTNPNEFADDVRVVFSYGFLHPPRNEIHKIARRVSDDFELRWKSLNEKWLKDLKTFQ